MSEKDVCREAQEMENATGYRHGQIHEHLEEHLHGHYHGQICAHDELNQTNPEHAGAHHEHSHRHCHVHSTQRGHGAHKSVARPTTGKILAIRSHSGISGDIILAGLSALLQEATNDPAIASYLRELPGAILPELAGCFSLDQHEVGGICGWQAQVNLPHAHEHRDLAAIKKIIDDAQISEVAKRRAGICFELLATCEAAVHGIALAEVHFHEVGALDSILDICGACELYARLGEPETVCSPLPVADGEINCAHGILPAPAPAVLRLLQGIPVRPFAGDAAGRELLTPTGVALLRAFNATFGSWPAFRIDATVLAYGQLEFVNAPNGVIFAVGSM